MSRIVSDLHSSFDDENSAKFGKREDGAIKKRRVIIIEWTLVSELRKTLKGLLSIVLVTIKTIKL